MGEEIKRHKPSSLTVKKTDQLQKQIEDLRILSEMIEIHGVNKIIELSNILQSDDADKKIDEAEKIVNNSCHCRGCGLCQSIFRLSLV